MLFLISMIVLGLGINEAIVIVSSFMILSLAMYFSKEPSPPSWYKDDKQLFEEQSNDASRKKLYELVRDKKFHSVNERLFISKEIFEDLEKNEIIIGSVLSAGRSFINSRAGYRDVRVSTKIDSDRSTYQIIVKDLQGEIIHNDDRQTRINLKLNPENRSTEIEFRWIAMSEKGPTVAIAYYPGFITKIVEGVGLKWKK